MQKKLFAILLITLFLALSPISHALAESGDRIASLYIHIWPEYDDPGVLVMYDGELASKENLPREISFLVPASARIAATAYGDGKGGFFNTDPWKTQDAGNGLTRVTFAVPTTFFHVEFYYNPLQGAPDKTMDFIYTAAQPADQVHFEIQQPLTATNFKTNPPPLQQVTRGHDFKYHLLDFPSINAGQTVRVQVSYTKTDPNPTIANIAVPPDSNPATASTPASSNLILPIALAAGGLALGVLGFLAWRSRRQEEAPAYTERRTNRRKRKQRATTAASGFCHECGRALAADDLYCSRCGTKRKG